ncbi:pyridoxal kinase PdxY [Terracoccus sp. 273MFTsu3.1]|uniref:pyridoxal kinase PdxY n=1 Tax=Terracoccus sp. 273MFTsu3.1 TaxID=1172188 RepID=UPI00048D3429|nr:pyridoxal kinase PdxY [Terracoccus sp. 273MFTsu3.1]
MQILSIQSHVAYGHAGNSAAVFPLQRLGHEVYPVLTVTFSNHTGYGSTRGPLIAPADVAAVIDGVEERGAFPTIDAVLSGYQGAEAVGEVVLDAVARVKAANPAAVYCCDPVMGDVGRGFFVREGIPEYMRDHVVPKADIVTPNQFELEFLVGRPVSTQSDLVAAARELVAQGPTAVLVTSALTSDTPEGSIEMVCVTADDAWVVTTPMLPMTVRGGGDVTAAVFLAHYLTDGPDVALRRTAATMYAVLERTHASGSDEMLLVAEQDAIAHPDEVFEISSIS